MVDVERRKQERYKIWVDATVQTPETSISAIASNISGDGIRIQSQKSLSPGTKILTTLKIKAKKRILRHRCMDSSIPYRHAEHL